MEAMLFSYFLVFNIYLAHVNYSLTWGIVLGPTDSYEN